MTILLLLAATVVGILVYKITRVSPVVAPKLRPHLKLMRTTIPNSYLEKFPFNDLDDITKNSDEIKLID